MTDYNPDTPTWRGMQWRPTRDQVVLLNAATRGIAMRFRGTAVTLTNLHQFLEELKGNPGLALEVVDVLQPALLSLIHFPNTDSGAVFAGWADQAGTATAAAIRAAIDDQYDETNYARNVAQTSRNTPLDLLFRGNVAALTATRIVKVLVRANVSLSTDTTVNGRNVRIAGLINRAGTTYEASSPVTLPRDGRFGIYTIGEWALDPATDRPWTMANYNLFLNASNDEFGVRVRGQVIAEGLRVAGLWLEPVVCVENRKGFFYQTGQPRRGWTENAVSGASVLAANTWYWLVVSALTGSATDSAKLRVLVDENVVQAATAASVGEHRTAYTVLLASNGGPILVDTDEAKGATEIEGGQIGVLLDAAGILAQSNPYVEVDTATVFSGGVANQGTQITTDSGAQPAYAGIQFPVGWADVNRRPDQPLRFELRSGAGALTGAGTLHRVGFVTPGEIAGPVVDHFAAFTQESGGAFTPVASTQYTVVWSSTAKTPGWKLPFLDTRSDLIGSGTTVSEIESASQGGQTDSWQAAGTALDRYDQPVVLVASPAAPGGLTVTEVAATDGTPPYLLAEWNATAHVATFDGYLVKARPSRSPAQPFKIVGRITVPTGYTRATVEAQHRRLKLKMLGWGVPGGQWESGWDIAVSSLQTNGLESQLSTIATRKVVPPAEDEVAWFVSDESWWLDHPAHVLTIDSEDDGELRKFKIVGSDEPATRSPIDRSGRDVKVKFDDLPGGEDRFRYIREAARGHTLCLHSPEGDRWIGALGPLKTGHAPNKMLEGEVEFVGSPRGGDTEADFNLPCSLVLDGTNDCITHADHALLNPGSGPFTVIVAARFADVADAVALSKGNLGTADGFGVRRDAPGSLQFFVDGATGSGGPSYAAASWFDKVHVFGGSSDGNLQQLYRDGIIVTADNIIHGEITNDVGLAVGANNGGASGFMACDSAQSWAIYSRVLTADEHLAGANYLLGIPGYRLPAGVVLLEDLRDRDCWDGIQTTLVDQSGNGLNGTVVGGPATRGLVAPLSDLEQF